MQTCSITLTEETTFKAWLEKETASGLIDFKLYPESTSSASTEDFYAELNDMNYAIQASRYEKITDL